MEETGSSFSCSDSVLESDSSDSELQYNFGWMTRLVISAVNELSSYKQFPNSITTILWGNFSELFNLAIWQIG